MCLYYAQLQTREVPPSIHFLFPTSEQLLRRKETHRLFCCHKAEFWVDAFDGDSSGQPSIRLQRE